jgi:hypothetical protein
MESELDLVILENNCDADRRDAKRDELFGLIDGGDLADDTFDRRKSDVVLDWRNYVPHLVESYWSVLTHEERILVAQCAHIAAQNESER